MSKSKKRTITTVISMSIVAILILLLYFYWTNRTDPLNEASVENLSEVEQLLNKDLELYYPETPRELVKLYSSMMKVLYTEIDDTQTKALALKMRELCDTEFLDNNPEESYLNNLYTEIAAWKEKDRRITNFLLTDEDKNENNVIDGKEYATVYISYTFQEKSKFSETWRYLTRKNEEGDWKILGWEYVPEEEQ